MTTIMNSIASHLSNLSATHPACVALGTTFQFSHNMFIGIGPATESDCIDIIPYGGSSPEPDGYRQNPSIQIRSKTDSRQDGINLQQALINELHMNGLSGSGKVFAKQSIPIILGESEGGEYMICVSNYDIKHVKV